MESKILINGHKMKPVNINILFLHKMSSDLIYNMSGHQFDTRPTPISWTNIDSRNNINI